MVSVLLLTSLLAVAAPPAPGRVEYQKATKLYAQERYEEALPWFERAYERSGHRPSTTFGLAQCERAVGRLDAADERWLLPRVTTTGVWLERELDVRAEYALHLCFGPGHARVARVCRQRCDAHGQWRSSAAVDEVPGLHPRDRDAAVRAVFDAAERADYFGPIGVDVLVYDDGSGRSSVYVGSDVQGRFTMGWNGGEPVCASCACGL